MRKSLSLAGVAAVTALVGAVALPASAIPAAPHGPKNVIVLIGDGMGYTHVNNASLYANGVQYRSVAGAPGEVTETLGTPSFSFESFPMQTDMTTYWAEGSYDPELAWTDFDYVNISPTDSAAAGTAMATGVKTYNAGLGVDYNGNAVENLSERAISQGRSAGVVSSVPFSHATPAAYVVHNASRNDYHGIAHDEVYSDMTVVMGAGHPFYNDSNEQLETPRYSYISETDFAALSAGETEFSYIEETADFEALTTGETPDRVFGIPQVGSTLQQGRAGESVEPYDVAFNDVPSLETMTQGALNVLDNNEEGFFLMVEGGAIDWTGHANDEARNIEETLDFVDAVDATIEWVEQNSNWRETLVIVTADHETGYLSGEGDNPNWSALEGLAGEVPSLSWNSGNHTNQLVPVYALGAGAKELERLAVGSDPVRGAYLDNTDLANFLLEDLWAEGPGASAGNGNGNGNGRQNGNWNNGNK